MKFRHLEYFVTAAEELNFTHAADRCTFLNRRSASKSTTWKANWGLNLFERRRKGVVLTPAGKSFLIDARRILVH